MWHLGAAPAFAWRAAITDLLILNVSRQFYSLWSGIIKSTALETPPLPVF